MLNSFLQAHSCLHTFCYSRHEDYFDFTRRCEGHREGVARIITIPLGIVVRALAGMPSPFQ
jgi:hypothetical protein